MIMKEQTASRFILEKNIALRSYKLVPFACIRKECDLPEKLETEEFLVLIHCNGTDEVAESALTKQLENRGLIRRCGKDERLSPWQEFRSCDNYVTPYMNLQITERCNYNCLHCFNAAGCDVPKDELSLADANALLDEAARAGINCVLLTGGEPFLHPHFMDIVRGIYQRDMRVFEINTNGAFITDEVLEALAGIGCRPKMKISFDGFGFHDRMRGVKGAETAALRAIEKCKAHGFPVMIQMNLNRLNETIVPESLEKLDAMHVDKTRVIRTSESPRWISRAEEASISWSAYFAHGAETAKRYARGRHDMILEYWEYFTLFPREKSFLCGLIRYNEKNFSASMPLCKYNRGMVAIGADGQLYPCLQFSGLLKAAGVRLGNALEKPLTELLSAGKYTDLVRTPIQRRMEESRCGQCPYLKYCGGGCPLLGTCFNGRYTGEDNSCCLFFRDGWYDKLKAGMPGYKDLNPMPPVPGADIMKQWNILLNITPEYDIIKARFNAESECCHERRHE